MARTDRNKELEDSVVPSHQEVQKDVLEWWCHVVLQDCTAYSPQVYSKRVEACHALLEEMMENIADYGRLYNRTQLASLCADLVDRPIDVPTEDEESEEEEEEEDDDDSDVPLSKLSPEKWDEYIQWLQVIRGHLLRKDANVSEEDDVNEELDTDLEALSKFQQDYHAVLDLLKLCRLVAQFHTNLEKLASSKAKKQTTLLQKLEKAVDDYKEGLEQLDLDSDAADELTSFLLADIYKVKPKELAQRLQEHVLEVMTNNEYELGYAQIVQKTRRLLSRWHSQVLDVPTLCRLGYGGFVKRKSSIVDDNVSVSSWGADEEEYKEQKRVMEEESSDDLEGYATAPDDATADPEEADAAFAIFTQPPAPESPETKKQDDDEEDDDGEKKPRAKRKKSQQEQGSDAEPSAKRDSPRRSSRLAKNASPPRMATRSRPAKEVTTGRTGPPPKKKARQTAQDDDELMTQPDASPPRKRAAAARKPSSEDDESITEPESSPPRKKAAAARKPPAKDDSDTESEPAPPKKKKPARRAAKKKPTVIEWSESEDDEVPTMPTRPRKLPVTNKPKTQKKRRRFTDEEKEAIRAGVHRFGVGQWATIRLNSGGVLLSRTTVNIKDCYRTMQNRGEI